MQSLNIQRLSGGTFFKLLLFGSVFTHVLLVLFVMMGALFGMFSPTEGEIPMPIWKSELFLLAYLFLGILFMPIWAGIFWIGLYPGIWLYSKFKPMVLLFNPVKEIPNDTQPMPPQDVHTSRP